MRNNNIYLFINCRLTTCLCHLPYLFIPKRFTWSTIFIGKTAMTATGRAALVAGVFTGTSWLLNTHLDRIHQKEEA